MNTHAEATGATGVRDSRMLDGVAVSNDSVAGRLAPAAWLSYRKGGGAHE
jgi:hypothetical protein